MVERPYRIAQELNSLRPGFLARLDKGYRLMYKLGYAKRVGDHVHIKLTSSSDPTGDIAADQENLRDDTAAVAHHIMEMVRHADKASSLVAKHTERPGSEDPVRHLPGEQMYPEEIDGAKREMKRRLGRKRRAS